MCNLQMQRNHNNRDARVLQPIPVGRAIKVYNCCLLRMFLASRTSWTTSAAVIDEDSNRRQHWELVFSITKTHRHDQIRWLVVWWILQYYTLLLLSEKENESSGQRKHVSRSINKANLLRTANTHIVPKTNKDVCGKWKKTILENGDKEHQKTVSDHQSTIYGITKGKHAQAVAAWLSRQWMLITIHLFKYTTAFQHRNH